VDEGGLGGEFRALRVAAGRTVASVAADAGLSVPYIANLENGRGNPTLGALNRLAAALGRRLVVQLAGDPAGQVGPPETAGSVQERGRNDNSKKPAAGAAPASLIRFARTQRFRRTAAAMAPPGDEAEFTGRLVAGLAGMASVAGRDLNEGDWGRLLDAVLLVTAFPHGESR
jgi:transcriptional regulator with XRE-family HTH domain